VRNERIVLIGTGQVASVLLKVLHDSGHEIRQVLGRNKAKTEELARSAGAEPLVGDYARIHPYATLYIIAVSDDAIKEVVAQLPDLKGMVVHTSGSVSSRVIMARYANWGVFYPLQTFTQGRTLDFNKIPIVTIAASRLLEDKLKELAASIGSKAHVMSDEDRRHLHLAAVMVNNFTNHLLTLAGDYLKARGLDDKLLDSLAFETVSKAIAKGAPNSQTGPAKRGDSGTLSQHLEMLQEQPDESLALLYRIFSDSIRSYYTTGN
jgi:predicted short-subunit dehydrogenase-like oxidoreductase (DUF2520 family)